MFFSKIPNLEYTVKPLRFPISENEYVLVKNFFRRFKLIDNRFGSVLYFNEYTIEDGDRPDTLAYKFYGSVDYDWIILITNNIINTNFDFPIKDSLLYDFVAEKYEDPDAIHHYETKKVLNSLSQEIQKEGLIVDQVFYQSSHKFYDVGTKTYVIKQGSAISYPVSNYEYEKKLNDERRKIFILRPEFLDRFVSQMEELLQYSPSSSYIDRSTKKAGK